MALKMYLRGSTLVETLVSMTLIMIILGASFSALSGIEHSTMNQVRYKARFIVKDLLADQNAGSVHDTTRSDFGGFAIEKELMPYDDSTALRILVVNAVAHDGKIVFSGRRIIVSVDD